MKISSGGITKRKTIKPLRSIRVVYAASDGAITQKSLTTFCKSSPYPMVVNRSFFNQGKLFGRKTSKKRVQVSVENGLVLILRPGSR